MYFDEVLYLEAQCLLEGRRLFQCGYPKVRRLLEEILYLFFTAMKIHTMAGIVKKQANFIFIH